jgi:hypothetical protein
MNSAFPKKPILALAVMALALSLSSCPPPTETGTGSLKIVLSGGSSGRALSPATINGLSYKLIFSGPGGETLTRDAAAGTGSISLTLNPGHWTIQASAYTTDEILYGKGETLVTVAAGRASEAALPMHFAPAWYVAAGGNDDNAGSEAMPFATVNKAVAKIKELYTNTNFGWPSFSTPSAAPALILVSGMVTENGTGESNNAMVDLDNSSGSTLYDNYPPIILAGKTADDSANILNADHDNDPLVDNKRVLYIEKADVTLGPGLTLKGGRVTGAMSAYGGGVYVNGGTFTMNGGTISYNEATNPLSSYGGGVYVSTTGSFTMNNGTISHNTASAKSSMTLPATACGGGVYFAGSAANFSINGGIISYNTVSATTTGNGTLTADGGGVYFDSTSRNFTMNNGTITENGAAKGGGVYVSAGSFTMSGSALISENQLTINNSFGGGVYFKGTTFDMHGGTISDNKASGTFRCEGGGVYISDGSFNIGGTALIADNKAYSGGGVFAYEGGSATDVTMSGGTIYGNSASSTSTNYGGGGMFIDTGVDISIVGGTIGGDTADEGNTARFGGGLYVKESASFNIGGNAKISGNLGGTDSTYGGGVYFAGNATDPFVLQGSAIISNNVLTGTSASLGGGVFIHKGKFEMSGSAIISGNKATTAAASGGGVYVNTGTFIKTGGTIYGNSETDDPLLRNITALSYGHAVYALNFTDPMNSKKRDTTAYTDDPINTITGEGLFDP